MLVLGAGRWVSWPWIGAGGQVQVQWEECAHSCACVPPQGHLPLVQSHWCALGRVYPVPSPHHSPGQRTARSGHLLCPVTTGSVGRCRPDQGQNRSGRRAVQVLSWVCGGRSPGRGALPRERNRTELRGGQGWATRAVLCLHGTLCHVTLVCCWHSWCLLLPTVDTAAFGVPRGSAESRAAWQEAVIGPKAGSRAWVCTCSLQG